MINKKALNSLLNNKNLLLAASFMVFPTIVSAGITVDNSLGDWFTGGNNGVSLSADGLKGTAQFFDDGTDGNFIQQYDVDGNKIGSTYLDPGYGGQAFDTEGLFVELDGDTLYIAIVTGLKPGDTSGYFAGDILFDTGGDAGYEYALVVEGDKHDSVKKSDKSGTFNANRGDLFKATDWNYGIWDAPKDLTDSENRADFYYAHPTTVSEASSKVLNTTAVSYSELDISESGTDEDQFKIFNIFGDNSKHYIIEASIDLSARHEENNNKYGQNSIDAANEIYSALTSNEGLNLHWTPTCNNDYIMANVKFDVPTTNDIPEPTSLALMGLGVFGLLGFKRRKA